MREAIRQQTLEVLSQNQKNESVLVIFSSSFRKRLALALQIWLLNDCTEETTPEILREAVSFVGPMEWGKFIQGSDPTLFFDTFNTIPNGNSATDTVHFLGVYAGYTVVALPNGGEKHLPGLTPTDEATNKAYEETPETLRDVFGESVVTVGMDAVISRSLVAPEDNRSRTDTVLLGKPVSRDVRLQEAEGAEYSALTRQYIREVVGMDVAVELENISATVIRKLQVLGEVTQETSLSAVSYIAFITTITDELLAEIIGKLNREAAGFQLLQWLLIAQEEWSALADSLVRQLSSGFFTDTRREDYDRYGDFLTVCEVLGVSFITVAKMLELAQEPFVE